MLPYEPEKLEALQARFTKALVEFWLAVPSERRPGTTRANVFDFEDGWVSRSLTVGALMP